MKVWRYCFRDDDSPSGTVNWYFKSKREVDRAQRDVEAKLPAGYQLFSIEKVTIPTRKKDLIEWLNNNS